MKYVILAAGKGTRLHPITHHVPKPLLPLLSHNSLLEYEIKSVTQTNIFDEIIIITGYKEEMIRSAVSKFESPIPLSCIHNVNWDHPSPLYSLDAISRTIKLHDVVISNGDTIHTPTFFNAFRIRHPIEDMRLFVSLADQCQEDDMRVSFSSHQETITQISKALSYQDTHAVSSGMLLLKGFAKRALFLERLTLLLNQNPIKPYWHAIIDRMVKEKIKVNFTFTPYDSWFEVDSIDDLVRVNKYI